MDSRRKSTYFEPGIRGRKTGVQAPTNVDRDANGLENVDDFFRSPMSEKNSPIQSLSQKLTEISRRTTIGSPKSLSFRRIPFSKSPNKPAITSTSITNSEPVSMELATTQTTGTKISSHVSPLPVSRRTSFVLTPDNLSPLIRSSSLHKNNDKNHDGEDNDDEEEIPSPSPAKVRRKLDFSSAVTEENDKGKNSPNTMRGAKRKRVGTTLISLQKKPTSRKREESDSDSQAFQSDAEVEAHQPRSPSPAPPPRPKPKVARQPNKQDTKGKQNNKHEPSRAMTLSLLSSSSSPVRAHIDSQASESEAEIEAHQSRSPSPPPSPPPKPKVSRKPRKQGPKGKQNNQHESSKTTTLSLPSPSLPSSPSPTPFSPSTAKQKMPPKKTLKASKTNTSKATTQTEPSVKLKTSNKALKTLSHLNGSQQLPTSPSNPTQNPPISPPPEGVRRSKRQRFEPLDFWRNERIIYGRQLAGKATIPVIREVVRIPSEEPEKRPRKTTKRRTNSQTANKRSLQNVVESNPEEDMDAETEPFAIVQDYETKEEVEMQIAYTAVMIQPRVVEGQDYMFEKVFDGGKFVTSGIMELPKGGSKSAKMSGGNCFMFYVIEGAVEVTVHLTTFVVATGGMFMIPRGNNYELRNVASRTTKMFFTQARKVPLEVS